jgi:cell division protein FtsI (penicillin-binding protein 3)
MSRQPISQKKSPDRSVSDRSRVAKVPMLTISRWRFVVMVLLLVALPFLLVWHIAGLQVLPDNERGFEFLQSQGERRTIREEPIPSSRGVITDRNGEPLAVSTPVATLWADPKILPTDVASLTPLAKRLGVPVANLRERVQRYSRKEFMYLARRIAPAEAEQVLALRIPGVYVRREYKRFYPAGEVTAQLVGFTDMDDSGQEGVELAYDEYLTGLPGAKRVVKDLKGNVIKELGLVRSEKPGESLALSIDLRIQYLAYRELKAAIKKFKASSGSVVVLDVESGEVLAMANQPSFNPNARHSLKNGALRNRAITDLIEPGSTVKPFTMVAALESGKYHPHTVINTNPGYIRVGRKTFYDHHNYQMLDLTSVLTKSSQVGTTKIAMNLEADDIRDVFVRVGLGQGMGTGFPGEATGALPHHRTWPLIERANFAFGYGLTTSAIQLAQAYGVLAANGVLKPVSLLKQEQPIPGEQVVDAKIASQIRDMLQTVTEKGGTGAKAAVPAYNVSGKTGTVHKVGRHGYEAHRYVSLFAGIVPAEDPKLVAVVIIDDPQSGEYYGGAVAGPVFSGVMTEALRLLNVPPRDVDGKKVIALDVIAKRKGGVS